MFEVLFFVFVVFGFGFNFQYLNERHFLGFVRDRDVPVVARERETGDLLDPVVAWFDGDVVLLGAVDLDVHQVVACALDHVRLFVFV